MLKSFKNQYHELKNDENRKFQTTMSTFFLKKINIVMSLHAICVVYKGEIFSLVPHV